MHISLTPELEAIVRKKVESGMYNNASEVVREALRMMELNRSSYEAKLENLRALIREGDESGVSSDSALDVLQELLDEEAV